MGERQLRPLVEGGSFFEGPRWHAGRWWASDFYRHAVFAIEPDGAATEIAEVEGQPSGLGWLPDGTLLIVSMKDHTVLRLDGGRLSLYADLSEFAGGPLNDMAVDAEGLSLIHTDAADD
jgi:sugar lactone lactonase YvrE